MKKRINIILESIMIFFIFYLVGCFIEVSFDINKWDIVTRFFIAISSLAISSLTYALKNDSI